jgi:hypothetical protein
MPILALVAGLLAAPRPADAQDPAGVALPPPALRLPLGGRALQGPGSGRVEPDGPHRFLQVAGKAGYQPLSLRTSLRVSTDLHLKDVGTILLSVCPLETLAVAAEMSSFLSKDPDAPYYALVSDGLPANDRSRCVFAWWWTSHWHPQMVAAFGPRRSDFELAPCAIVEHLPLRAKTWYQLAFTWNKPAHRLRLYVDGVLCGTTDYPFDAKPPRPQLYLGNTAIAFADLEIYDRELSGELVGRRYERADLPRSEVVARELATLFTVRPRPRADWAPDRTWALSARVPFTRPEDLRGWMQQGCTREPFRMKAMETTPEGLLLETPDRIDNESRMYLWSPANYEGDIAVQLEFRPEKDSGLALLVVDASGMQREDFIADHPPRATGSMSTIIADRVRNYHWEFFRRTGDVRADLGTQVLVKNPWLRPLGMAALPRLEVGRWHRLLFLKEGAQIRAAIDGRWALEARDDPLINTGPVFDYGRVGLRLMYGTRMRFRDLAIWTRNPGVEILP